MSLTYRKSINKYTDLPSHEITRANKDGERDGKENFPESSETEPSGAILKILTDARTAWDKYLSEKKNYLEDQNKKLSNLEYDIDTNIQAEISKESAKLDDEQNLYISQEGNKSSKYIKLSKRHLYLSSTHQNIHTTPLPLLRGVSRARAQGSVVYPVRVTEQNK